MTIDEAVSKYSNFNNRDDPDFMQKAFFYALSKDPFNYQYKVAEEFYYNTKYKLNLNEGYEEPICLVIYAKEPSIEIF